MGWLANLLGQGKKSGSDELQRAFAHIRRILDDEDFQIEMLPEPVQALIRSKTACDVKPGATGEFGLSPSNPIPVNGPIGQLAYLSKLRAAAGENLLFHRIGAAGQVDVFEAVTVSGSQWFIFFLDMYFPKRSQKAPPGLTISPEVSQFSGFTSFCSQFPHDFADAKAKNAGSGLNAAYIPLSKVETCLQQAGFERPLAHLAKLDLVRAQLSSILS